jgi:hypothetical protein
MHRLVDLYHDAPFFPDSFHQAEPSVGGATRDAEPLGDLREVVSIGEQADKLEELFSLGMLGSGSDHPQDFRQPSASAGQGYGVRCRNNRHECRDVTDRVWDNNLHAAPNWDLQYWPQPWYVGRDRHEWSRRIQRHGCLRNPERI